MQIKYAVYKYTNGDYYVPLTMPKELVQSCNFEHKDRFHVVITNESIIITYDPVGALMLAKKNISDLVINLTKLNQTILDLLIAAPDKSIPAAIKGDSLVLDLTKLNRKSKGFGLFGLIKKGFK